MKKYFAYFSFVCILFSSFTACGDDESSNPVVNSEDQSSSAESSSSSFVSNDESKSSDSQSSSSVVSSSSVALATPCKTDSTDFCEYGTLTDERDGQVYKTVHIGEQWWMAENLNYKTDDSYCYNSESNCDLRKGRYYRYDAVSIACPNGWHVPSSKEFYELIAAVGGSKTAGKKLKSTSLGWFASGQGSDEYGFSADAYGNRNSYGTWGNTMGSSCRLWAKNGSDYSYMFMTYQDDTAVTVGVSWDGRYDSNLPIRCLKD